MTDESARRVSLSGPAPRGDSRPVCHDGCDATRITAWVDGHAAVILAAGLAAVSLGSGLPLAAAGAASFAAFWYQTRYAHSTEPWRNGYANYLTALRLVLILGAAAAMNRLPALLVFCVFAINIVLDVADGYVARKFGEATELGMVFDREADGVFVLVAYMYFILVEGVGLWVLLPGLLPYIYRLLTRPLRDPAAPEAKQRLAATLAGANYVLLLIAVILPPHVRTYVLALSAVCVLFSFCMSFRRLCRDAHSLS